MFSSSIQSYGDNQDVPDYVYYNADIINNTTADKLFGVPVADPQIRFNETRDKAIIKNASDYYFSIIRFTMDGANKDLPLFIPNIQTGTGQANFNLTTYSMAVTFEQTVNADGAGNVSLVAVPEQRFIQYEPETVLAPLPRPMSASNFVGQWGAGTQYLFGQIVSSGGADQYGQFLGPFYTPATQPLWSNTSFYQTGALVQFNNTSYEATASAPIGIPPIVGPFWALAPPIGADPILNANAKYWSFVGNDQGNTQDLTGRYYWVYTYQHWVDLWNKTMVDPAQFSAAPLATSTCAYQDTYNRFAVLFNTQYGSLAAFPYPTFGDFCNAVYPPVMKFIPETSKFEIYLDSAGFGDRLTAFTPTAYAAGPPVVSGIATHPVCRLFFNSNMFGLFSNYDNYYWNGASITGLPFAPNGYVNEILAVNKAYQNIADFRLTPYTGVGPLGYTPVSLTGAVQTPNMINRVYYLAQQDYSSTDSLWSPISSVVFTSTLLPIKAEATGAPVVLGLGNTGFSSATVQSAFQPIITDISLDTSQTNADSYRKFIYYAPSAEYRLSDFSPSKQEIRNIDIQVFWKNRLDNQLYPITMFNLSTVSIKVMFKHKDAGATKVSY